MPVRNPALATPFTIWGNYHSYLSPSATYVYYVKQKGDVKGLYYIQFFIIMQYYESVLCSSSLHLFDQKYWENGSLILWNIMTV